MLNPVLFTLLEKYRRKPKRWKSKLWKRLSKKEKQIPVDICNHALLVGFGRVGSLLGEKLRRRGFRWWLSKRPALYPRG